MKKTVLVLGSAVMFATMGFTANAEEFVVPEAEIIVPLGGEAELLNNMYEITWGYYGLEDNAGDDPITSTLTFPDGTVKTVKGQIADANKEGEIAGEVPTTVNNALMFRNFMTLNEETMMYEQQYGTYKVEIPEGVVLVNGVENPAATLYFEITGIQPEEEYMEAATLFYPSSYYTSFLSTVELSWNGEPISFVDGVASTDSNGEQYIIIDALIDGMTPITAKASIYTVYDSGANDQTQATYDVLYIYFDDFIGYFNASTVDIQIPSDIVVNAEGLTNPQQTVTFYLMEQLSATLTPSGDSELEAGKAIVNISWNGILLTPGNGFVTLRNIKTGENIYIDPIFAEDNASMSIDLNNVAAGNYELIIPEAYVLILLEESPVGDIYAINEEIVANYTILDTSTAIESPDAEDNLYKVYSIDGVYIMTTGDLQSLRKLTPGIYLINGKKTIIK